VIGCLSLQSHRQGVEGGSQGRQGSTMWLQILPVAAIGLGAWLDLVAKTEEYLGERLLLHAAVTSGSLSMVVLLLDLHELVRLAKPGWGSPVTPSPTVCEG